MSERLGPSLPATTAPKSEIQDSDSSTGILQGINKRRGMTSVVLLAGALVGCATPRATLLRQYGEPVSVNPATGQSLTPDLTEKDIIDSKVMMANVCPPDKEGKMFYTDDGLDKAGALREKKLAVFCHESDSDYETREQQAQRQRNIERTVGNLLTPDSFDKGPVEKIPPPPDNYVQLPPENYELYNAGGKAGYGTLQEMLDDVIPAFVGGMWYAIGQALRRPDETKISGGGASIDANFSQRQRQRQRQGQAGPTNEFNPVNTPTFNPVNNPVFNPPDAPAPTGPMPMPPCSMPPCSD